jgi:hypothetical protein
MAKPTPETIAAGLIVSERCCSFASLRIPRDHLATRFVLTDRGRAVPAALLEKAEV